MPFYVVNAATGQAVVAQPTLPNAVEVGRRLMQNSQVTLAIADEKGKVYKIFSRQPFRGAVWNPYGRFFENFTDNLIAAKRLNKALTPKQPKAPKKEKKRYAF